MVEGPVHKLDISHGDFLLLKAISPTMHGISPRKVLHEVIRYYCHHNEEAIRTGYVPIVGLPPKQAGSAPPARNGNGTVRDESFESLMELAGNIGKTNNVSREQETPTTAPPKLSVDEVLRDVCGDDWDDNAA